MNPIRHLRRFAAVVAGLAASLAAFATPAFAVTGPHPGGPGGAPVPPNPVPAPPVQIHTVVTGGMPGWQIALIAVGASLLAAVAAVLVDRALAGRRRAATATA